MKLSEIKKNQKAEIKSITNYSKAQVMGLVEGTIVKCVSLAFGTIELDIYGSRLAISSDVASTITAELQ